MRSLAKPTVCTTIVAVRTRLAVTPHVRASHSHDRCANCRFGKRTYAFGCHTTGSSAAQRTSVVQTVGLAIERTRSTVTPPVRASHSADRCVNFWFGKRTYAFGCHTAGWSVAQPRSLCKLSVWQENVRVRLPNRWLTVGLASERTRSALKQKVR